MSRSGRSLRIALSFIGLIDGEPVEKIISHRVALVAGRAGEGDIDILRSRRGAARNGDAAGDLVGTDVIVARAVDATEHDAVDRRHGGWRTHGGGDVDG